MKHPNFGNPCKGYSGMGAKTNIKKFPGTWGVDIFVDATVGGVRQAMIAHYLVKITKGANTAVDTNVCSNCASPTVIYGVTKRPPSQRPLNGKESVCIKGAKGKRRSLLSKQLPDPGTNTCGLSDDPCGKTIEHRAIAVNTVAKYNTESIWYMEDDVCTGLPKYSSEETSAEEKKEFCARMCAPPCGKDWRPIIAFGKELDGSGTLTTMDNPRCTAIQNDFEAEMDGPIRSAIAQFRFDLW